MPNVFRLTTLTILSINSWSTCIYLVYFKSKKELYYDGFVDLYIQIYESIEFRSFSLADVPVSYALLWVTRTHHDSHDVSNCVASSRWSNSNNIYIAMIPTLLTSLLRPELWLMTMLMMCAPLSVINVWSLIAAQPDQCMIHPMASRYTVICPDTNIFGPITLVSNVNKSSDPGCDCLGNLCRALWVVTADVIHRH